MIYDLNKYRRNVSKQIQLWFENRPELKPEKEISVVAIGLDCPIIVVGYLMLEVLGENKAISEHLVRLEEFYDVEEVIK